MGDGRTLRRSAAEVAHEAASTTESDVAGHPQSTEAERGPDPVPTTATQDTPDARSQTVKTIIAVTEDMDYVAPCVILPLLESYLTAHTTMTEPKRQHLKERVNIITDVFPIQDRPLPKLDILAVLCAYAGQPVSILGDLDIRLVLTEIIAEIIAEDPPTPGIYSLINHE